MKLMTHKSLLLCSILALSSSQQASAANISTLYNTGVDNAENVLTDNTVDPHYTLISGATSAPAYVATSAGGYPIGPWHGDSNLSAWIAPNTSTNGDSGATYTYRTTFDLTGFNPASASFFGRWASDDYGVEIYLNGVAQNIADHPSYTTWSSFSVNSGFISGVNTLDFVVLNSGGGPTGLRVELKSDASPVPVPGAAWLMGSGLLGLFIKRKRG